MLNQPPRGLAEPRLGFDLPAVATDTLIERPQLLERIAQYPVRRQAAAPAEALPELARQR